MLIGPLDRERGLAVRRWAGWLRRGLIAGLPMALAAGCGGGPAGQGASPVPAGAAAAQRQLAALRISRPGTLRGYTRERFGPEWADVDRNGCSTRADILARDLKQVRRAGRCTVRSGTLHDPYTGRSIAFRARLGQAGGVHIDHMVPLAYAWRMGAARWDADTRERFANDPANLLAVSARANMQKGDDGPAAWRPRRGYRCRYAIKFISVASRYEVAVSGDDRRALRKMLGMCPARRHTTTASTATPATATAGAMARPASRCCHPAPGRIT